MPRRPILLGVALICAALLAGAAAADGARAARPRTVASGIPEPAGLAFDPRGGLWVASGGHLPRASNGIWYVRRRGARPVHAARGLFSALGLTWVGGRLYVAHIVPRAGAVSGYVGRVTALTGFDGRRFASSRVVVDGLPVGRHRLGSIAAGPGGRLYVGVGSRYDNRAASDPLSGTVVSFRRSGRGLRVEARGLRNPYGLAFLPGTSQLLVSEHGRDDLGLRSPPEELNLVDVAGPAPDFGFPDCFGQGGAACRGTRRALVRLPPHAAPGAVAVRAVPGSALTAYVPQFGSSFPDQPTGGDVVAVALQRRDGRWRGSKRRLAGNLGRQNPLGAAVGPDGRLHVTLWTRGRIVSFGLPRAAAPRRMTLRAGGAARPEPARLERPRPGAARPPALFTRLDPWLPGAGPPAR